MENKKDDNVQEELNKDPEVKKDSLLWSEEDYSSMEKMTGFDEESVLKDQKKGLMTLIFSLSMIIVLVIGIMIGYKLPKKNEQQVLPLPAESGKILKAVYSKKNESGELYLYLLNGKDEELLIMSLDNYKYNYIVNNNEIYILSDKNGLVLEKIALLQEGFYIEKIKNISAEYKDFAITSEYIYLIDSQISVYDLKGNYIKAVDLEYDKIFKFDNKNIIYLLNNDLYSYNASSENKKLVAENVGNFIETFNNKIFYIKDEALKVDNKVLIDNVTNLTALKISNKMLIIDANTIYLYNNSKLDKIKEYSNNIKYIHNYNADNIIIVFDDYDENNCSFNSYEADIYSVNSNLFYSQNIDGCISNKIIYELAK